MTRTRFLTGIAALAAVAATAAVAQSGQGGGTATYWMSAETMSGFAASAMNPNDRGAMIGALMSGRGSAPAFVRNLRLQLGSPRAAGGAPSAEHLPPPGLGAGPSLPLLTPEATRAPTGERPQWPGQAERPRGRILVYWGCGEHARQGQPFTIDLANLSAGQMPPALAQSPVRTMTPPSQATSRTYGEWPNQRSSTTVPASGSLVGEHVVRGNYTPEIRFALAQGQDFLAPVTLTANTASPSGAVPVAWQAVPNARAYFLFATGAAQDGTIVMWSSSEVQFAQLGMLDYLAEDEIARLIQQRVLLAPQTQQCTVPAEVAGAVQGAMLSVNAFGPEANFSHPARPARPPRGWTPEWLVKLRTRSTHMGMLGMDMEAMTGRGREQEAEQPRRRRSLRDRLRDRVLGQ